MSFVDGCVWYLLILTSIRVALLTADSGDNQPIQSYLSYAQRTEILRMDMRAFRCSSRGLGAYYFLFLSLSNRDALSILAFWLLDLMLLIMTKQSMTLNS